MLMKPRLVGSQHYTPTYDWNPFVVSWKSGALHGYRTCRSARHGPCEEAEIASAQINFISCLRLPGAADHRLTAPVCLGSRVRIETVDSKLEVGALSVTLYK